MAKETKSISVNPNDEQDIIEIFQIFGWELLSSQEIFNKNTHLETRDDGVYNVTSTTNYVKLVFSRETTMPNYSKFLVLENEYWSIDNPDYKPPFGTGLMKIIAGISAFGGFVLLISGAADLGIYPFIFGIGLLGVRSIIKSKSEDKYSEELSQVQAQRIAVLKKAEKLWNM